MDKELEQDILAWFADINLFTKGIFLEWCKRVADYRGLDDFNDLVSEVPLSSVCSYDFTYNEARLATNFAGSVFDYIQQCIPLTESGFPDQKIYEPQKNGMPYWVMWAIISRYGEPPCTASKIASLINSEIEYRQLKKLHVTYSDVSSAVQTINQSFRKQSKLETDLIRGGDFIFNRKKLPLVLANPS